MPYGFSEEERERPKAVVEGHDWARIGHKPPRSASAASNQTRHENAESPALAGLSTNRGVRLEIRVPLGVQTPCNGFATEKPGSCRAFH